MKKAGGITPALDQRATPWFWAWAIPWPSAGALNGKIPCSPCWSKSKGSRVRCASSTRRFRVRGRAINRRLLQTLGQTLEAGRRPSAVILVFFVGNDFVDVQMGGAQQFQVEDGLLVRRNRSDETPPALQAMRMKALRNSRLLQVLMGAWWQWSRLDDAPGPDAARTPRRWDEWMREFAQIHLREHPRRTAKAVARTLDLLTEIHQACRRLSADFLLVVVPRSYQVYANETEQLKTALGLSDGDLDLDRPQRILTEWAERSGVRVVDLLDSFREHHRTHPRQRLFYYPDAHLNRLGHNVAADSIQPALSQMLTSR